ncbi:MAG TPA: hypothetical protein VNL92_04095, partial [Dehalococcoidia bacterium]|nr:hypothetical protein [Dehalococcoidia bacterium]
MLKRLVPAALVLVAMMVPLPSGLANAGSIDVTPSGPYLPGLNGIVVEGSSSAAAVAHTIEAESGLEVDAIWLLSGTWRFYLPDQPEIDGGLNEFSGPVAAAFVVLAAATPVTSEPTGIAEVDAVVEAVLAGNVDALVSMVRYTTVVCTSEPPAAGLPPLCASVGLPEGSELATLPII